MMTVTLFLSSSQVGGYIIKSSSNNKFLFMNFQTHFILRYKPQKCNNFLTSTLYLWIFLPEIYFSWKVNFKFVALHICGVFYELPFLWPRLSWTNMPGAFLLYASVHDLLILNRIPWLYHIWLSVFPWDLAQTFHGFVYSANNFSSSPPPLSSSLLSSPYWIITFFHFSSGSVPSTCYNFSH